MKTIIVLGSTGSIGKNTLEVAGRNKDRIRIRGLAARGNIELLEKQITKFCPEAVAVWDSSKAGRLKRKLAGRVKVYSGMEGLLELVRLDADMVVSALVGIVGLEPSLEAIRSGKDIALANKEILVAAGRIIMAEAEQRGVKIIPVDSEHSALMQCLWERNHGEIRKIILTASGGAFYQRPGADLSRITPEEALKHPTWSMGPKVTVDSATLINKGFEVIEASCLFRIPVDKIEITIHPQSIVHAMVEFIDGSVTALMHAPDMRLPIQYAISWPERWGGDYAKLELSDLGTLDFIKPDMERFPALELAYRAGRMRGTVPAVFSAADEVCVNRFLNRKIKFTDIVPGIKKIMEMHQPVSNPAVEDIMAADEWARRETAELLDNKK